MKYTPVMTLRVETAGAPQIPSAREALNLRAEGAQAQTGVFYELVKTAQAILISYILIDGSAQVVSYIVGVISTWIRNLR